MAPSGIFTSNSSVFDKHEVNTSLFESILDHDPNSLRQRLYMCASRVNLHRTARSLARLVITGMPPSPRLSGVRPARIAILRSPYVIGRSGPHLIYRSMRLLSVIQSGVLCRCALVASSMLGPGTFSRGDIIGEYIM